MRLRLRQSARLLFIKIGGEHGNANVLDGWRDAQRPSQQHREIAHVDQVLVPKNGPLELVREKGQVASKPGKPVGASDRDRPGRSRSLAGRGSIYWLSESRQRRPSDGDENSQEGWKTGKICGWRGKAVAQHPACRNGRPSPRTPCAGNGRAPRWHPVCRNGAPP